MGIEHRLIALALELIRGPLFYRIKLFMLLQLIESLPLLFNHVTMCKWEIIHPFNSFHSLLVVAPFNLLVTQDLIRLNECVSLMDLVLLFK